MNRKREPKSPRLLMRELWAYVARGPGEPFEGILAMLPPMTCLPLVAADLARVQSLLPRARMIASMFDCPFRILLSRPAAGLQSDRGVLHRRPGQGRGRAHDTGRYPRGRDGVEAYSTGRPSAVGGRGEVRGPAVSFARGSSREVLRAGIFIQLTPVRCRPAGFPPCAHRAVTHLP